MKGYIKDVSECFFLNQNQDADNNSNLRSKPPDHAPEIVIIFRRNVVDADVVFVKLIVYCLACRDHK